MGDRTHKVELVEAELIAARGTRRVSWRVERADGWIAAREWPGAVQVRLDPGPGTVWETRIDLELPTGTRLERIESRPTERAPRDPLEYLTRDTKGPARDTRRTPYRVGPRGELISARGA